MTLLRAADLKLAFGSRILFEDLTFVIEEGERVGLVGVNGSGKSTLMKILAGAQKPDTGELQLKRGATVTYLPQEPPFPEGATVAGELSMASGPLGQAIADHAALADQLATMEGTAQDKAMERLQALAERIERLGGWDTSHHAKKLLDRLGVKDWERPLSELSGGTRKRVAIARALLTRPDLLLLDEPTNHLDADTTDWLEEELDALPGALLLVTHDRYFLDGLVDRIVEIAPREKLVSYPGNYEAYLEQKLVALSDAENHQHKRDRWIANEVAWLRRGPQARRTKSKVRIERARKLLTERGFTRPKVASLQGVEAPRLGHTVLEAKKVGKRFADRKILEGVDLIVQRGERIGIVGKNGVGKTTFLRVLLGELPPDSGEVVIGKNTKVAYYDQQRQRLDLEKTVYEAAWDEDYVTLGDKQVALRDYLEDLLFPVPMQRMQVKALSGGERNRLVLARMFLEGANVLVLDEPTNDLDLVTLNVLEALLLGFRGAVLLVTHDRYFLDKVATTILAFEGEGKVIRYEGNYQTYRTLKAQGVAPPSPAEIIRAKQDADAKAAQAAAAARSPQRQTKLSYKDQRELDGIESAIEQAEQAKAALELNLHDPAVYSNSTRSAELHRELAAASAQIEKLYARWQQLQSMAAR